MIRLSRLGRLPAATFSFLALGTLACAGRGGAPAEPTRPAVPDAQPPAALAPTAAPPEAVLTGIVTAPVDGGTAVVLSSDRPLRWTTFRDIEGHLVVELPETRAAAEAPIPPADALVAALEVSEESGGFRGGSMTRLRIVTREDAVHALESAGDGLRLVFRPVAAAGGAWAQPTGEPSDRPPATDDDPATDTDDAVAIDDASSPMAPLPAAAATIASETLEVAPVSVAPPTDAAEMASTPAAADGTETEPPAAAVPAPPAADPPATEPMEPAAPATAAPSAAPRAEADATTEPAFGRAIRAIDARQEGGALVVDLIADGSLPWSSFRLGAPDRFVIDLPGVVNHAGPRQLPIDHPLVAQARLAQFRGSPDPVARLVLDLREAGVEVRVTATDGGLRVDVPAPP